MTPYIVQDFSSSHSGGWSKKNKVNQNQKKREGMFEFIVK